MSALHATVYDYDGRVVLQRLTMYIDNLNCVALTNWCDARTARNALET
jgi:hypothetical protein